MTFLKAYIKSMRLYYAFITGIAGWLGLAFYEYLAQSSFRSVEVVPSIEKKILMLILLFLSWGINQIINDYLGLKEDRINAPHRPMVTGELDPAKALMFSGLLLVGTFLITFFYLEPLALIPAILGIVLNVLYEYAKGCGILGNLVFGIMIAMGTVFGFLAAGPTQSPYFTASRISVLIIVVVMNGLMTYYTYFKDYRGDMAADKKTLVVQLGLENSGMLALILSFFPILVLVVLHYTHYLQASFNNIFLILFGLTCFLNVWTGYLYYKNPQGRSTYYSLSINFRACACGQATLIALFNSELALLLFLFSYIFVGFFFDLHTNPHA